MTKRTVQYVVFSQWGKNPWADDAVFQTLDKARRYIRENLKLYGDMGLTQCQIKERITETIVKERTVK